MTFFFVDFDLQILFRQHLSKNSNQFFTIIKMNYGPFWDIFQKFVFGRQQFENLGLGSSTGYVFGIKSSISVSEFFVDFWTNFTAAQIFNFEFSDFFLSTFKNFPEIFALIWLAKIILGNISSKISVTSRITNTVYVFRIIITNSLCF